MSAAGPHPLGMAVAHFCLFGSQAAVCGLLPVTLLVLRPAFAALPVDQPAARRATASRLAQVLDAALGIATLATLALLALQADVLARVAGSALGAASFRAVARTHVGEWSVLRLGVLLALGLVLHGRVRAGLLAGAEDDGLPRLWWWAWGGLSAALLLTVSLTGHAAGGASAGLRPVFLTADGLHLAAGAVWLTGVAVLALVLPGTLAGLRRTDQEHLLAAAVTAFSRVALVAIPLVAVTGTLSGLTDVGRLSDLRLTGYGHALALKVWLFGWVLAFGGYNHYRLRRRLAGDAGPVAVTRARQTLALTVTGELVFGLLVVAATAILVGLPKSG